MSCKPRKSSPHDVHLARDKSGRLVVSGATSSDEIAARKRVRRDATRDRNADVADFIVGNCQGKTKAETSAALADAFPYLSPKAKDRPRSIAQVLSGGRQYAALVRHDGTAWSRAA